MDHDEYQSWELVTSTGVINVDHFSGSNGGVVLSHYRS